MGSSRGPGQRYTPDEIEPLYQFCISDTQRALIRSLLDNDCNLSQTARSIGKDLRNIQRTLDRIRRQASKRNWSPQHDMDRPAAETHRNKFNTILYKYPEDDPSGRVMAWVKNISVDDTTEEMQRVLLETFEDYKSLSKPVKAPRKVARDLLAVYPMGDPHVGMYAYAKESGDDFDVDIATRNLRSAVYALVDQSPPAETAVILDVGDFFHADSAASRSKSGNVLDTDTRWSRVLKMGTFAMIDCIEAAKRKHKNVIVRCMMGNHDEHTSLAMTTALWCFYHNDKRVTIDDSPSYFWYFRFGKVLLGSTHGDMAKPDELAGIMAADVPDDWGNTEFRMWLTGHIHSWYRKEYPGCEWESFRTLAAKDFWHSKKYRAMRDMHALIFHKDYGMYQRHIMNIKQLYKNGAIPSMLQAAA